MLDLLSGKKEDLVVMIPAIPNRTKAIINTLTATGYFIK
jgi:hypothetical protein